MALADSKRVYGFIPRWALFYLIGAALFAVLGLWKDVIVWLVIGFGWVVGGYIVMRRGQGVAERREKKERVLSEITGRGSRIGEWIFDHTIFPILNHIESAIDSRGGQRIGGFFAVVSGYIHSIKQRYCPLVKVE